MSYKLVKFNVVPGENEQIDAVVKVCEDPRSVIHGVVINECDKPIKDAVVKLFKESKCNSRRLEPITHTFTDEYGQFLFGPLCSGTRYVVKVWVNNVKSREIVIKTDCCDDRWRNETSLDCNNKDKDKDEYDQEYIHNIRDCYEDDEE